MTIYITFIISSNKSFCPQISVKKGENMLTKFFLGCSLRDGMSRLWELDAEIGIPVFISPDMVVLSSISLLGWVLGELCWGFCCCGCGKKWREDEAATSSSHTRCRNTYDLGSGGRTSLTPGNCATLAFKPVSAIRLTVFGGLSGR